MLIYSIDILILFLFGMHSYLMVYLYRRNSRYCDTNSAEYPPIDLKRVAPSTLPMVTVQLPIYNEFYVVDRLIENTTRIKWPKSRLEIQVLDDSTDETAEKAAGLVEIYRKQGFQIRHIHRKDRTGHKAGALKAGLEIAKGDYVAIFDADFVPSEEFLIRSVPYFSDPDIGMVQTRWGHINDEYSILTKAQSFGIDGHFMIEQVARNANSLWMNFNGTGGIWKKSCIYESGNWQSDTLTEDFDLSYRAELAGWKFRYFKDIVNPSELPATISAFKSQQFRWCKGSIQTAVKLIPRILKSDFNWKIKAEAITHLLNYSVHPLMIVNILLTLPLLMMEHWTFFNLYETSLVVLFAAAAFLAIGTFGPTLFYMYSQRELYSDWKARIVWMPILMMIGTGIAVSNSRAWLEAILGVQSTFKRTPKYRIESKKDRLMERMKYQVPLDPVAFFEFLMGLYCLAIIYYSVETRRLFLLPFILIYASGFFYVSILSFLESFVYSGKRGRGEIPEVELKKA
jgi:cellulose synthase/poly-beta-1,6-N-acetylglucosamine synthase-like glycosyltransferase